MIGDHFGVRIVSGAVQRALALSSPTNEAQLRILASTLNVVEVFVISPPCSERFSSVNSAFPLFLKTNTVSASS